MDARSRKALVDSMFHHGLMAGAWGFFFSVLSLAFGDFGNNPDIAAKVAGLWTVFLPISLIGGACCYWAVSQPESADDYKADDAV